MKAELIRVEEAYPWYFTTYYYKCIECGKEYSRHQCNERISPYCGECQRKHDAESQKQRIINKKNKLIVDELEKFQAKIQDEFNKDCHYDYTANSIVGLIRERISELKGDNNEERQSNYSK